EAGGQWRFTWDQHWRESGETATNLTQGNYTIELRPLPGYLAIPPSLVVSVSNGATMFVTNQYFPSLGYPATNRGSLTVNLGSTPPAGASWRFVGEPYSAWRVSGTTVSALVPDSYLVEFKPVSGYATPSKLAVQVPAGPPTMVSAGYLLAPAAPSVAFP